MLLEGLGRRIRKRREERGLKQADIANALSVSAQAVSKWERGENAPDITLLGPIATLLGVSTDWLLGLNEGDRDVFEATVFLSDVRGFAKRAATTPPAEVATWANGFFYHLTEAVLKFDGVPVKQMGDGLLAFFTGPRKNDRAIAAAQQAAATAGVALRVALSHGEIYLGSIGHPDYALPDITGAAVNEAFLTMVAVGVRDVSALVATAAVIEGMEDGPPDNLVGPITMNIDLLEKEVTVYTVALQP